MTNIITEIPVQLSELGKANFITWLEEMCKPDYRPSVTGNDVWIFAAYQAIGAENEAYELRSFYSADNNPHIYDFSHDELTWENKHD